MKSYTKLLLGGFVALFLALAVSGCNTARGFGQDMQKAGDKIEDKAAR